MEPLVAAVWSCDAGHRAGLPGALPVRVPAQPRHALGHRLARLADRHRRLPRVRRQIAGGCRPCRRPPRPEPCTGSRTPTASSHRRQRPRHDVRRRRHRHPPRPGAGAAGRADPRQREVLGAFRYSPNPPCCTPTASLLPRAGRRPGLVELPLSACDGPEQRARHLRHDPAAAAADAEHGLHRHARRRGPRSTRAVDRSTGWSTPTRSTPRTRSPPSARLPELNTAAARLRRRLPRLGLPRGRRRSGVAARRPSGCAW